MECGCERTMNKLVSTERKMLGMICAVTLRDRINSLEVTEMVGEESVEEWSRRQLLRWFGHVLRRGQDAGVSRVNNGRGIIEG